ncbi:24926_t:CDS:2 [Gigaspora margarita]|uniref:24926_t:CDS:1 n=1 Tax=Gigaspora margarita TaxID=4874 RepID=A0ABN7W209_GIGMA|nr:24926_t:CDS:2 [Gigaspora margarita]
MLSRKILTQVFILIYSFCLILPNSSLSSPILSSNQNQTGNEKVFNFTINKGSYAPDGFERNVYLINGQLPGPTIECDKGDTIVINVINELDEDTTIHSHGISQRGNPWYDGVPGQSQCGIPSNGTFTYKFQVDQSGTYWYHSHLKTQYIDGLSGPLIIHDPDDPYIKDYDEEIIVLLQDWYHNDSKPLLAYYLSPESHGKEPSPDNGLINGKNSYNCSFAPPAFSAFVFSIDGHLMNIIEVEGMIIQNHTVHQLPINVGQRYSVIVTADNPGQFWMRAEMETDCYTYKSPGLNPLIKAIVTYNNSTDPPSSTAWNDSVANCVDFNASDLKPYNTQNVPDANLNFTITIEFYKDKDNITLGTLNNSTYVIDVKYPTINKVYDNVTQFAADQNVFLIEKNNTVVDIILLNYLTLEHPFHLHGHVFWVLGSGGSGTKPDYNKLNTKDPIQRDTATVPALGWTVLRFVSNNPGVWGFHCHIEWHVEVGLVAQFVTQPDLVRQLTPPNDWKALCSQKHNKL